MKKALTACTSTVLQANMKATLERKRESYERMVAAYDKVPGWLHTLKPGNENVFDFVVNELGKGAATQLKVRGSTGIERIPRNRTAHHSGRHVSAYGFSSSVTSASNFSKSASLSTSSVGESASSAVGTNNAKSSASFGSRRGNSLT